MMVEKTRKIEIVLTEEEKENLRKAYDIIDKIYWEMCDIKVEDIETIRQNDFPPVSLNQKEIEDMADNLEILAKCVSICG